ncbi:hypothetical protein Tco_1223541 [Tanacetum coccineum]
MASNSADTRLSHNVELCVRRRPRLRPLGGHVIALYTNGLVRILSELRSRYYVEGSEGLVMNRRRSAFILAKTRFYNHANGDKAMRARLHNCADRDAFNMVPWTWICNRGILDHADKDEALKIC